MPVIEAEADADGRIVGEAVDLVRLEAQVPPAVTSFSIELPVFSAKRTWRAEAVMPTRIVCGSSSNWYEMRADSHDATSGIEVQILPLKPNEDYIE